MTLGAVAGFLLLSAALGFLPERGGAPLPAMAALGLRGPFPGPAD